MKFTPEQFKYAEKLHIGMDLSECAYEAAYEQLKENLTRVDFIKLYIPQEIIGVAFHILPAGHWQDIGIDSNLKEDEWYLEGICFEGREIERSLVYSPGA